MKRLSRNGLAKKRYYAGVAYNPRPAPTPKSHARAITWVEENGSILLLLLLSRFLFVSCVSCVEHLLISQWNG
jgi:hypothetical protein